jgi:hypothetical protein
MPYILWVQDQSFAPSPCLESLPSGITSHKIYRYFRIAMKPTKTKISTAAILLLYNLQQKKLDNSAYSFKAC